MKQFEQADADADDIIGYALMMRTFLYTLFSRVFAEEPSEKLLEVIRSRQAIDETVRFAQGGKFATTIKECVGILDGNKAASILDDLTCDYTCLFIGPGKLPAPPWESVYVTGQDVIFQESTLEVRNAYRKEGYLPVGYPKVADDHVAIECSFIQKLAENASMAFQDGDVTECRRLLEVQTSFLEGHLLRWLPCFADRIGKQTRAGQFYPTIARCLAEFCTWDVGVASDIRHHLSASVESLAK